MAKRNKRKRNPSKRNVLPKSIKEKQSEWFAEWWEASELVRWIKSGYNNPGIAILGYAKKYGFDLTKREWLV